MVRPLNLMGFGWFPNLIHPQDRWKSEAELSFGAACVDDNRHPLEVPRDRKNLEN